jgi:hypothetical protein
VNDFIGTFSTLAGALRPVDYAAIAAMLVLIRLARHAGMWIYALGAVTGPALDECSHYLEARCLGGSPSFPSLLPRRTEKGWHLGHVQFRAGHLRAMFVGLAPLLLAPLAVWWAVALLAPATWPLYLLHAWVVAALLQACWPSPADWKLALPALAVLVPLALALLWYFRRAS